MRTQILFLVLGAAGLVAAQASTTEPVVTPEPTVAPTTAEPTIAEPSATTTSPPEPTTSCVAGSFEDTNGICCQNGNGDGEDGVSGNCICAYPANSPGENTSSGQCGCPDDGSPATLSGLCNEDCTYNVDEATGVCFCSDGSTDQNEAGQCPNDCTFGYNEESNVCFCADGTTDTNGRGLCPESCNLGIEPSTSYCYCIDGSTPDDGGNCFCPDDSTYYSPDNTGCTMASSTSSSTTTTSDTTTATLLPTTTPTGTETMPMPTGTPTTSPAPTTPSSAPTEPGFTPITAPLPGVPEDLASQVYSGKVFQFDGCAASPIFTTFELVLSDAVAMDVELCLAAVAADPANYKYAGLQQGDCFGATTSGNGTRILNSTAACAILCPGDTSEFCGGEAPSAKRQVALGLYLSLYEVVQTGVVPAVPSPVPTTPETTINNYNFGDIYITTNIFIYEAPCGCAAGISNLTYTATCSVTACGCPTESANALAAFPMVTSSVYCGNCGPSGGAATVAVTAPVGAPLSATPVPSVTPQIAFGGANNVAVGAGGFAGVCAAALMGVLGLMIRL